MNKWLASLLGLIVITSAGQNRVFIEQYRLYDHDSPTTIGLVATLLKGVLDGTLQAYRWDANTIPLSRAEAKQALKRAPFESIHYYDDWDAEYAYEATDRVRYDGKDWEAMFDLSEGVIPASGDSWVQLLIPEYYSPDEIGLMEVEYIQSQSKRSNQIIHFYVQANMDIRIFSISFQDVEKFLESTPFTFYNFTNPELGWMVGDVFAWDYWQSQGKLVKELGEYAYRRQTDCTIHTSYKELASMMPEHYNPIPFSDDNASMLYRFEFIWKENIIDTIRLYYDFGTAVRLADIPATAFKKHLKTVNTTGPDGFGNLSEAIQSGMLKPFRVDTAFLKNAKRTEPMASTAKKFTGMFAINQISHCHFDTFGNQSMLSGDDNFGAYLIHAFQNWTFNDLNRPYENDSLIKPISKTKLLRRMVKARNLLHPFWKEGISYFPGDTVKFKNRVFRCKTAHDAMKTPLEAPETWQPISIQPTQFKSADFNAISLHHRYTFNQNGQVQSRILYAVTIHCKETFYRPMMTLSPQTLKYLLSNMTVGSNGKKLWSLIEQGNLTAFVGESSTVIRVR